MAASTTVTQAEWETLKAGMHSIMIDGEDLSYMDVGPRDAPNLIFVNGALLTVDFWKYQLPVFAKHFRCIAYNYRTRGARANNAEGFTADLRDIIARLQLDPVTIIASSMSGLFATRYAAEFPERIDAMVICSSFPMFPQRFWVNVGQVGTYIVSTPFIAKNSRVLVCGDRDQELGDLFLRTVSAMDNETVRNRYNILRTTRNHDILPRVKGVPTLIMAGDLDKDVPVECGKYLAENIRGADFTILEGGGHLGYFEQHEQFNAKVFAWLEKKGLMPAPRA